MEAWQWMAIAGLALFLVVVVLHISPLAPSVENDGTTGPQLDWQLDIAYYQGDSTMPHRKGKYFLAATWVDPATGKESQLGNVAEIDATSHWTSIQWGSTTLTALPGGATSGGKINIYVSTRNGVFRYTTSLDVNNIQSGSVGATTILWSPYTRRQHGRTYTWHDSPPWFAYAESAAAATAIGLVVYAVYEFIRAKLRAQ